MDILVWIRKKWVKVFKHVRNGYSICVGVQANMADERRRMRVRCAALILIACLLIPVVVIADTRIFSPDSTSDGHSSQNSYNSTYTYLRNLENDPTNGNTDPTVWLYGIRVIPTTGTNLFHSYYRGFININTSAIPDNAIVTEATLQIKPYYIEKGLGTQSFNFTRGKYNNPANPTTQSFTSSVTNEVISNTKIWSDFTVGVNATFSITPSAINKSGYTQMMARATNDYNNAFSGTWTNGDKFTRLLIYSQDYYSAGSRPILTVVYHIPGEEIPDNIAGLTNTTASHSIVWKFNIPKIYYDHLYVMKNGVFYHNITNTTTEDLWEGLDENTEYTFSSKTCNAANVCNSTFVNQTARTKEDLNNPITDNKKLGWTTLINNNYLGGSYTNNTFIASGSFTAPSVVNETLTKNPTNLTWSLTSPQRAGELYIGQLYPAGHTKFRFNMSVVGNSGSFPYVRIYNGRLFEILVYGSATSQEVDLNYYNASGVYKNDKTFTVNSNFVDFTAEYFPNGTTTVTNNRNPSQTMSTKYHLDSLYPYNYISSPLIRITSGFATATSMNVTIYNFEQSVPKNLITVWSDNSEFPFGQDGPRLKYADGTNWLKTNKQRETLWVGPRDYNALNASQKADVRDLIANQGFELGIHFTDQLNSITWSAALAEMSSETASITNTFGKPPLSWVSLGNNENSLHANEMWKNYSELWRNAPMSNAGSYDSVYAIYSRSTVSTADNTNWWKIASQYKSFNPAYTHSVNNPLTESSSVDTPNFTTIMGTYVNNGVKIVPYAEWYYKNMNTVQPITNIYLADTGSHFSINTQGYNATTTIYDPYRQGIWYSTGNQVITTIDKTHTTKLIIKTNSTNPLVQKLKATITVSENSIDISVKKWNTSGDYYKIWNEYSTNPGVTSQHTIGDFPNNQVIQIKKNGVNWHIYTTNSSGFISFDYDEGYSSGVQFEAQTALSIPTPTPAPLSIIDADFNGTAHFNFNGRNTTPVDSWNWSIDGVYVSNSRSLDMWLTWGVRHIVNLTVTNGTNAYTITHYVDLGDSGDG